MISDEAISVACEQKLWWISQGVSARKAWFAMTGKMRPGVDWYVVEARMIRWLCEQDLPAELERIAA